jgi:hypothetical protein
MNQSSLIKTNKKLLKLILVIIMFSVACAMFVPANILMLILSSWKIQLLLLLSLMLCLNSQHDYKETLYALVIGSFYISPLASYVYFNLANGPILLGLSLSVMLITICVNYLTVSQANPLDKLIKISALTQFGKGSLISLCIIGVGVICFSILNIIPLTTVLYTASLSWFAIQMIYLRAVNILLEYNALGKGTDQDSIATSLLEEDSDQSSIATSLLEEDSDQASIAAMSLFADPLNIFIQENNLTNNVVTRLILLIGAVIFQVLQIPVSVFYYLRYKWYVYTVRQDGLALQYVPKEAKIACPEICLFAVLQDGLALQYVPEEVQRYYQHIRLIAVNRNIQALQYVPDDLKKETYGLSCHMVDNTDDDSEVEEPPLVRGAPFDFNVSTNRLWGYNPSPPLPAASFRPWKYNSPFLPPYKLGHSYFTPSSMSAKSTRSAQLAVASTILLF